jgi:hypothetical protein
MEKEVQNQEYFIKQQKARQMDIYRDILIQQKGQQLSDQEPKKITEG